MMGKQAAKSFSARLLAWWDQHGRKDLPWQHPRDPYRVWVSEIMLQQTQVGTVIPYFERWMLRFPNLQALASASLDEVLSQWAGLGYYARARNLHKAAQACVNEHEGELPASAAELSALPGIGLSTANAIISQASDTPSAVLDGNVRRVLARHMALPEWPGSAAAQETLWQAAEQRLPSTRGADYTQAIMDLGALLCTRSRPRCSECPLRGDCRALAQGLQDELPAPKPTTKVAQRDVWWLVVLDTRSQSGPRILLEKRPPSGIWGGLWSLPEAASREELQQLSGMDLSQARLLGRRSHRLSHIAMSIYPVVMGSSGARQVESSVQQAAAQAWFGIEPGQLPAIPQPLAVLISQLREELTGAKV
jgi:A/G-specific adenine glycosylase